MDTIGILENGDRLSSFLQTCLQEDLQNKLQLCRIAGKPSERVFDILLVSSDVGQEIPQGLRCRVLLAPGRLAPVLDGITADWAVSYGISPRDSLTLSCFGMDEVSLALQREVVNLRGDCLEQQEILLPRGAHTAPLYMLACVGLQLLVGVPPEEVTMEG